MTGTNIVDPVAKASDMANPVFLAASMLEERAPDIVEAINDMPSELATAVLLHLPPERAIEVLDQPGLEREPELITLMPREAAARLLVFIKSFLFILVSFRMFNLFNTRAIYLII